MILVEKKRMYLEEKHVKIVILYAEIASMVGFLGQIEQYALYVRNRCVRRNRIKSVQNNRF